MRSNIWGLKCVYSLEVLQEGEALNVTSSTSDEVGQSKTKNISLPSNYKEATRSPSLSLETQSIDIPHATSDDVTTPAHESSMVSEDLTVSEWNWTLTM